MKELEELLTKKMNERAGLNAQIMAIQQTIAILKAEKPDNGK